MTLSKCGNKSVQTNAVIQAKIEGMQLELDYAKCFEMHVGKSKSNCPTLSIHGKEMLKIEKDKLGLSCAKLRTSLNLSGSGFDQIRS